MVVIVVVDAVVVVVDAVVVVVVVGVVGVVVVAILYLEALGSQLIRVRRLAMFGCGNLGTDGATAGGWKGGMSLRHAERVIDGGDGGGWSRMCVGMCGHNNNNNNNNNNN